MNKMFNELSKEVCNYKNQILDGLVIINYVFFFS